MKKQFITEAKRLQKLAGIIKEGVSIDGKEIDINSLEIEGIDMRDSPDFVDAYAVAASFKDGTDLSYDQIEILNTQHSDIIQNAIHDRQLYNR